MEGDVGEGARQAGCPTLPAGPTTVLPTHAPCPWLGFHPALKGGEWGVVQARRAEPTGSLTQHTQPGQLCMREEEGQEVVSSPAQSVCVRPAVMLGGREGCSLLQAERLAQVI